jgi:hypothetical protein
MGIGVGVNVGVGGGGVGVQAAAVCVALSSADGPHPPTIIPKRMRDDKRANLATFMVSSSLYDYWEMKKECLVHFFALIYVLSTKLMLIL